MKGHLRVAGCELAVDSCELSNAQRLLPSTVSDFNSIVCHVFGIGKVLDLFTLFKFIAFHHSTPIRYIKVIWRCIRPETDV